MNRDRHNSVGTENQYGLHGPGIESRWEIFRTCPDWPWCPPSLLYDGYLSFPGIKRPTRGVDHSLQLVSKLKKEYSYISSLSLCLGFRGKYYGELYSNENTELNSKQYFTSPEQISVYSHLTCPILNS